MSMTRPVTGIEFLGDDITGHFSHEIDMAEMVKTTGGLVAPMGNLPPLATGKDGTVEDVVTAARRCIASAGARGLILSWGGSMAGETPFENIDALIRAAKEKRT